MDQVFSLKKKHKNKTKKLKKILEKVDEFCQSGKVGTIYISMVQFTPSYKRDAISNALCKRSARSVGWVGVGPLSAARGGGFIKVVNSKSQISNFSFQKCLE